jgi:hypothetical protein
VGLVLLSDQPRLGMRWARTRLLRISSTIVAESPSLGQRFFVVLSGGQHPPLMRRRRAWVWPTEALREAPPEPPGAPLTDARSPAGSPPRRCLPPPAVNWCSDAHTAG